MESEEHIDRSGYRNRRTGGVLIDQNVQPFFLRKKEGVCKAPAFTYAWTYFVLILNSYDKSTGYNSLTHGNTLISPVIVIDLN